MSGGVARLAPVLVGEQRSVVLGFVPDPFWGHLAYLAGLTALVGVAVVVAARRRREPRLLTPALAATTAIAVVVTGGAGAWLTALPGVLVATGPEPSAWEPVPPVVLEASSEDAELGDPVPVATSPPPALRDMLYRVEGVLTGIRSVAYTDGVGAALYAGGEVAPFAYPQDGRATACARSEHLEVCVYPAFGERRARDVVEDLEPLAALLDGLPGVPRRVRMVPSTLTPCADGELQIAEDDALQFGPGQYHWVYADCALGSEVLAPDPYADEGAMVRSILADWAVGAVDPAWREASLALPIEPRSSFAAEGIPPQEQERIYAEYLTHTRAVRALAALPPEQVVAELAPLWERVRAGTLPLEDLPGGPG
jgi:hypothetical protein